MQVAVNALSIPEEDRDLIGPTGQTDGCFCACLLTHMSRCGRIQSEPCLHFDILLGKQASPTATSNSCVPTVYQKEASDGERSNLLASSDVR